MIEISVIICTWNRASWLEQTLARMAQMAVPEGLAWELLVVNNNGTDQTDAVVSRHAGQLPIRLLHEPKPGKVYAADRGIDQSRGSWLVWTDDDVLHDVLWLQAYWEAFRAHPQAAVFGGPISPVFEQGPPPWLAECLEAVQTAYGTRTAASPPGEMVGDYVPYGANFAVRKDVQQRYPFDPALGDFAGRRIGGYETRVIRQILGAGFGGRWVPEAGLQHCVRKSAQTIRFLRRFYFAQGLGEVLTGEVAFPGVPLFFGKPRWLTRRVLEAELCLAWRRLRYPPRVWIRQMIRASTLWGQWAGYRCPRQVGAC